MKQAIIHEINMRLRQIESDQLTPELVKLRDTIKLLLEREIYRSLYPGFPSFESWRETTDLENKIVDQTSSLIAEKIRALFDYTCQLQIDYLEKSEQMDLLYEAYNLEVNARDSRDQFLKEYFSKAKTRRLHILLSNSYGLKLDLEHFRVFLDDKTGCLEFRNFKYFAYHICLRLSQLFSIPLKNVSYKIAGNEKVYPLLDLRIRSNYTQIINDMKFDISVLEEFDSKLNELFPLFKVEIRNSINDGNLLGTYKK